MAKRDANAREFGLNHEDVLLGIIGIKSSEAAYFYLTLQVQVQCRFQHHHDSHICNDLDWIADKAMDWPDIIYAPRAESYLTSRLSQGTSGSYMILAALRRSTP